MESTFSKPIDDFLVNDLTTGGTTKALTAEMGKTLNSKLKDGRIWFFDGGSASFTISCTSDAAFVGIVTDRFDRRFMFAKRATDSTIYYNKVNTGTAETVTATGTSITFAFGGNDPAMIVIASNDFSKITF